MSRIRIRVLLFRQEPVTSDSGYLKSLPFNFQIVKWIRFFSRVNSGSGLKQTGSETRRQIDTNLDNIQYIFAGWQWNC